MLLWPWLEESGQFLENGHKIHIVLYVAFSSSFCVETFFSNILILFVLSVLLE